MGHQNRKLDHVNCAITAKAAKPTRLSHAFMQVCSSKSLCPFDLPQLGKPSGLKHLDILYQ